MSQIDYTVGCERMDKNYKNIYIHDFMRKTLWAEKSMDELEALEKKL